MKNIRTESARLAAIFAGSVLVVHLGYLWELLLQVFRLDDGAYAWLFVLLAQLAAFAAFGVLAAWTRWARAGWYMLGTYAAVGLAYYFAPGLHPFAYISSALWYGLFAGAIAYRAANKEFSKKSSAR